MALQGIVPIAPQYAIINALNDPAYRFIVACLSRRTGKTFIANTLGFLKGMEPNTKILIVSPNFSLTNISWSEQIKLFKEHEIEVVSKSKTSREIHLENGSMIKFGSMNNPDSLVGHSYDLIICDEAALDGKGGDVFNVQLRPTLDKPLSKIIFISTPRGNNYFKEFYERGFSEDYPKWLSVHSTYRDNPRASAEDIADAKSEMTRAEFQQEYEANFTVFEGQIYEDFNHETMVEDLTEMDFISDKYRWESLMGLDPGYKDHTGALVLTYDLDNDHFYARWDYQYNQRTTSQHCAVFAPVYEKYDIDMIFTDSAAAQFRQDMAVDYDLPSTKANKSVLDGIAYCQSLIASDRLTVCSSCVDLINMLMNYRWDANEALIKPKPVHDEFSHLADAFRYALYTYRT